MTFFKEKSDDKIITQTLQPTDDAQQWLPVRFVKHRNLFIHHYLYKHLLGEEEMFIDAYTYVKENITSIEKCINNAK